MSSRDPIIDEMHAIPDATNRACVFCSIVAGQADAAIVARNEYATAFMDLHPIRRGHVLVVPNAHEPHFEDMDAELMCRVFELARPIAKAVKHLFSPPKVGFAVAGFDVAHAHLHVVPLHDPRDLTSGRLLDGVIVRASVEELQQVASDIRQAVADAANAT